MNNRSRRRTAVTAQMLIIQCISVLAVLLLIAFARQWFGQFFYHLIDTINWFVRQIYQK